MLSKVQLSSEAVILGNVGWVRQTIFLRKQSKSLPDMLRFYVNAIIQKCKFITTKMYYRICREHLYENIFTLKNTAARICLFLVWILLALLWSYQAGPESLIQRASELLLKALAHLGEVEGCKCSWNGWAGALGFGLALFTMSLWGSHFYRSPLPCAYDQRVRLDDC